MTERPILFSAQMVRELLAGRKTQTRRLLAIRGRKGFFQFGVSDTAGYDWTLRRADHVWEDYRHDALLRLLPIQIGDRLWVREAHRLTDDGYAQCVVYEADEKDMQDHIDGIRRIQRQCSLPESWAKTHLRKRPSIHMPRWASRITLEVTNVRIERLQDISEHDAVAEGCRPYWDEENPEVMHGPNGAAVQMLPLRGPVEDFQRLWDSLNANRASWESNPWVAAYTFRAEAQNIDRMEAPV